MNSRPPPPQGPPPSYAFVTRMYKRSLRPVVMAVAFPVLLWTFFGAIGYFRNSTLNLTGNLASLKIIYIVMGALYIGIAAIEAFGLAAAATQQLPLVRIYAYGSVLVVLIIMGTGLLQIVTHFTMKDAIINGCTNLSEGDTIVYFGFWGPTSSHQITDREARELCQHYWSRDSWQDIVAFLVTSLLAMLFSAIAFSYLRQLLDPTSVSNAMRAPTYPRNGDYPSHYNPPYNANYDQYNPPTYGQPGYGYGNDAFVPPYEAKPGYAPPADKAAGYSEESKNPFDDNHGTSGSRV